MRHRAYRQRPRAFQREVLPGWDAVHSIRYRGCVSVPLGGGVSRVHDGGLCRDADFHRAGAGGLLLHLEKRRAGLVRGGTVRAAARYGPEEPMTLPEGMEPFALSSREKFGELTVEVAPEKILEVCRL